MPKFSLLSGYLLSAVVATSTGMHSTSALALKFTVGAPEVLITAAQRTSKGLYFWPDGNLGVVPAGADNFYFYAANGSTPARAFGPLNNIAQSVQNITITNPLENYNYRSGGPIYHDPVSGRDLMVYHAEIHPSGDFRNFYSVLGLSISSGPNSTIFYDLGKIIQTQLPAEQATSAVEVAGGSFVVKDGFMYVYFRDYFLPSGIKQSNLSVARAPIADVIANALIYQGTNFNKYFNGSWSEPGISGRSTALETGNPSTAWMAMSYNTHLSQVIMVVSQYGAGPPKLYMTSSTDGLTWTPRQPLENAPGESFYPSIVDSGANPLVSDDSFYVYYTKSQAGGFERWNDAEIVRRQVTVALPPGC